MKVPSRVEALRRLAVESAFPFCSEDSTGELLAVLSASVRKGGRICEIGTGLGVGLGWIVAGLGSRTDVSVITIESDAQRVALARESDWPEWVQFLVGNATVELPRLGQFDLIFADAEGGKWYGLELTLSALDSGGVLLLDDLIPQDWKPAAEKKTHLQKMDEIRGRIERDPRLLATELSYGSGLLLVVRQSSP